MNTSSRATILSRLRRALPESSTLPELPAVGPWQVFADRIAQFQQVLESVGGQVLRAATVTDADALLRQNEHWARASVRCSVVPGLGDSTFDPQLTEDPHDLENVEFAVLQGHFGVAENAAIWVTDDTVRHSVLYFIPQHMALVVPSGQIVNNMHEAYARIRVGQHPFAGFISGPSKTADIEQSLVIGAHGARSLIVFLIDDCPRLS